MKSCIRGVIAFSALFLSSLSVSAQHSGPEAQVLLANVAKALRQTNYRGRITYEHSGKLDVLEVSHSVLDGVEYEKVFYLNGPERSLVKSGRKVACETRGGKLLGGGIVQLSDGAIASIQSSYSIKMLKSERVAGRDSWVLQMVPRDNHRHGFILAIDKQSYLPTMSLFLASGRKVLERLHFVSLETDAPFTLADYGVSASPLDVAKQDGTCPELNSLGDAGRWQPAWLPNGFVLSAHNYTPEDGYMETYTDGLASFSVFVKPLNSANDKASSLALQSSLKKGATVVVMSLVSNASEPVHVSVLGEIPSDTASRIMASVKATSP